MNVFLETLSQVIDLEEIQKKLKKGEGCDLLGAIDGQKSHLLYGLGHNQGVNLVVTYDELRAKTLYEEYRFYNKDCCFYPAKDLLFYQSDIRGNALIRERISVIEKLLNGENITIITSIDALMNKLPSKESYEKNLIKINSESLVDLDEFRVSLATLGYEATPQVEHPGEFSVRGGIVDIFPLTAANPVRVELWGDEIDSIRTFDTETQKSIEEIDEFFIYPAVELVLTKDEVEAGLEAMDAEATRLYEQYRKEMKTELAHAIRSSVDQIIEETRDWGLSQALETHINYFCSETFSLVDYLPEGSRIFVDEIARNVEKAKVVSEEFLDSMERRLAIGQILPGQMDTLWTVEKVFAKISKRPYVLLSTLDTKNSFLKPANHYSVRTRSVGTYHNHFDMLMADLKKYKKHKFKVIMVCGSSSRAKRLADDLLDEGLNAFFTDDVNHKIYPGDIMLLKGSLMTGFEYPEAGVVFITDNDMFGKNARKKKPKKYEGQAISSFSDLHPGDYVVHENHGLGIFRGIEKKELNKIQGDYLKISYAKGGNLYVPVNQFDVIQKYASSDAKKPKLNTLGSSEWSTTKARVKSAVGIIAKELVELYATRQENNGYVYGPDTVWQQEFEEAFPFEETDGQLRAIDAVKDDMMSTKIMDRLICGDVGYGKTEVAIRAAFKAVQEGKQVVYLVPTTILAQQHFNTFVSRMKDYPVKVDLLCRFRTPTEQKKTIEDLKRGAVDIVIGTHRLLSKDVSFKNLGLLIIDEEQRFGVNHKERIKQLKQNIDVLTLSATPIPRTLHMSLIGIRDMSVLEEAPLERQPIQTFVFEYNEEMIREAIVREMNRGGQVYYVFNRVAQIAEVTAHIEALVPEARIAYAHGKMSESKLEEIMLSFINHEIDVLVSTTIIEIGLDISNVNTMIIHDSDQLGLSQLYQLRGRVGRSNRTAYAFLMYRKNKMLKEDAEKRLAAIKEFTDLGSGFKIAMRDLEIRGAGNLLGKEQHGHMEAVGYDLYCKMLNEAVKAEKGEIVRPEFETEINLAIEAFIPEKYVPNETIRIDLYKKISVVATDADKDDVLDELIDRFGEPPKPVINLLWVASIKIAAHEAYVSSIEENTVAKEFVLGLYPGAPYEVEKIPGLIAKHNPHLLFMADPAEPKLIIRYGINNRIKPNQVHEFLLDILKELEEIVRK